MRKSIELRNMGLTQASLLSNVNNDFELVIRATKELDYLLESHFNAPSGKDVGLHEKIGAATSRGQKLPQQLIKKMRYLVTVRNKLVHDRNYNAIEQRSDFIQSFNQIEAELKALIPQKDGIQCVLC